MSDRSHKYSGVNAIKDGALKERLECHLKLDGLCYCVTNSQASSGSMGSRWWELLFMGPVSAGHSVSTVIAADYEPIAQLCPLSWLYSWTWQETISGY